MRDVFLYFESVSRIDELISCKSESRFGRAPLDELTPSATSSEHNALAAQTRVTTSREEEQGRYTA
jgi:hypothetical protein